MWHTMFDLQLPVGEKLLRTLIVYALVAVLVRLTGKRGLAGLNNLDIVVMILLSNVVQNAIIGDDLTITGGALGAVTLVAVDALLNRLAMVSNRFSTLFDGNQTVLVEHGEVREAARRRVGLRSEELELAVRVQNGSELRQVSEATLEPGGHLLVTLEDAEEGATKGDIDRLSRQLERLEAALAARG